jgi:hypothetical protein
MDQGLQVTTVSFSAEDRQTREEGEGGEERLPSQEEVRPRCLSDSSDEDSG